MLSKQLRAIDKSSLMFGTHARIGITHQFIVHQKNRIYQPTHTWSYSSKLQTTYTPLYRGCVAGNLLTVRQYHFVPELYLVHY